MLLPRDNWWLPAAGASGRQFMSAQRTAGCRPWPHLPPPATHRFQFLILQDSNCLNSTVRITLAPPPLVGTNGACTSALQGASCSLGHIDAAVSAGYVHMTLRGELQVRHTRSHCATAAAAVSASSAAPEAWTDTQSFARLQLLRAGLKAGEDALPCDCYSWPWQQPQSWRCSVRRRQALVH